MNIKNIHEILLPRTIVLDAKSMDLYKKLKCEVCGSEDLIVGKHEINRGFTNCIVVSVFCNNCENWQEVIINDFLEMFKVMDVQKANMGIFDIEYGKGEIKINIPRNPIIDIFMGDLGQIKITCEDILEIKDLFKSN